MYKAGCPQIRVKIKMCGYAFDEFASKASRLGNKLHELKLRYSIEKKIDPVRDTTCTTPFVVMSARQEGDRRQRDG